MMNNRSDNQSNANIESESKVETRLLRRPIEWWERRRLEHNGCRSLSWERVRLSDATDLYALRNVEFVGDVSLGILQRDRGWVIDNARLENVTVGDYVEIRNIGIKIANCEIGNNARILNCGIIDYEEESMCGCGAEVDVLDETGSRAVTIYPGMSAQAALLMARAPKWNETHFKTLLDEHIDTLTIPHRIGEGSIIENTVSMLNVSVGNEVKIIGARNLRTGMVINNAAKGKSFAQIGSGVDAENFIIEDGSVESGSIIRNCYVGQGAMIEKGFTAHDSLIFANCSLENGEACALFAGPYTVSMHKSTLLIGCQTSFMNAGSGTNQSNHMYKLGPVHWGIMERGVKTSSDSYLMLGAKIGAFSLLMGQHKTHPDSSQFPFSYLFGDDRGATVVVPAVMLRSCGLMRDEKKWPTRDRRLKRKLPLHDRIVFDVLNPLTVDKMLSAWDVIENLLQRPADDDRYIRYRGMKFTRASLERAKYLYALAVYKYLDLHTDEKGFMAPVCMDTPEEWIDVAGLPMTRSYLQKAMQAESVNEMEMIFTEALQNYKELEIQWIGCRFPERLHKPKNVIASYAAEFDAMVEDDRTRYLEELAAQNQMLEL